jgi:hypothetical protein
MKSSNSIKSFIWKLGEISFFMAVVNFSGCATSLHTSSKLEKTYSDGSRYVGEYKYGERHGHGTMMWSYGTKYVGEYVHDKKHGQGTFTWPDGRKYVGDFKHDKLHGQGKIIWPNGDKFIGSFDDWKSVGIGTYISFEGEKHAAKLHYRVKTVSVDKGKQGEKIDLQVGDIILEYNGVAVKTLQQMPQMTSNTDLQKQVIMKILRDEDEKTFALKGGRIGLLVRNTPYLVETQKGESFLAGITRIDQAEKKQSPGDVRDSEKARGTGAPPIYPQLQGWAVIIGISKYENAGRNNLTNLIFADDDAKAFARVLRNLGWSESHMRLLVDEEATEKNIKIALESWLTKAGPDDQIVLFWAGHGYPDPEDPEKVYFACYDTDTSIPATGYRMDRVISALEERRTRNVVVFADTCHAGKLITRGERAISIMPKIDKMRREKKTPKGWIFMVGADTDRKAIAYTSWKNGAFT